MHMENPNEPIPESDPNDRTPTAGLLSRKVRFFPANEGYSKIARLRRKKKDAIAER